eukprot:TRINITY_DN52481_c0_g1_i1.p1 TRINITY_DN52481_c0_g1~~TRINITY_DN52481_c0_g1_i1.p1  ORF type:complete len:138 (+),score=32.82 TRINITY_DN52481_c0_g1_i1:156-569(+)
MCIRDSNSCPPNQNAGGGSGGAAALPGSNKQQYATSDCNTRSCELCNIKFQYKIACQHFSGRRHQDCLRELRHSKDPSYGDWILYMKEEYGFDQHAHMGGTESSSPVSYTHLRAHETPEHLVCRLLLEKKKLRSSES